MDLPNPWNGYFLAGFACAVLLLMAVGVVESAVRQWAGVLAPPLRWVRGRLLPGVGEGPVCGACRYSVRGLRRPVCPECGGDLRVVGVRSSQGAFGQLLMAAAGWSALVFFLAMVLSPTLTEHLAPVRLRGQAAHLFVQPRSGAFERLAVEYRLERTCWGMPGEGRLAAMWRLEGLDLRQPGGGRERLRLLPGGEGYIHLDAAGRRRVYDAPFDRQAALNWLRGRGVLTAQAQVHAETQVVLSALPERGAGPAVLAERPGGEHFAAARFQSSLGVTVPGWWTPVLAAGWAVLWLLGLWTFRQMVLREHGSPQVNGAVLAGAHPVSLPFRR